MNARPAYRRLPAAQRREAILQAATALIAERGYAGVSLEAFAAAAGMTAPGLLHHFASREQLLIAVLERRDRLDAEAATDAVPPEFPVVNATAARAVADRMVQRNVTQREVIRLYTRLSVEALASDHPAHDYFGRRFDEGRRALAEGLFGWHRDPESAATELMCFLDGMQLNWLRDSTIDVRLVWNQFADRLFA